MKIWNTLIIAAGVLFFWMGTQQQHFIDGYYISGAILIAGGSIANSVNKALTTEKSAKVKDEK